MKTLTFAMIVLAASVVAPVYAQQKLCPGLTGSARTNCLRAEQAKAQRDVQKANNNIRNIDIAIGVAKAGQTVGSVAAGALAEGATTAATKNRAAGIAAGAATSGAYMGATNAIANSKPCPGQGSSGVANSTPQRC